MNERVSSGRSFGGACRLAISRFRDDATGLTSIGTAETDTVEVSTWMGYAWALASSMAVTVAATPLLRIFDSANIVMLFLLTVVLVAAKFGRRPAIASALVNVLAFDVFFVPPRFSVAVNDAQYLLTFAVMIAVGLVVGQLTSALRDQARVAGARQRRALIHYEMAQALGKAASKSEALDIGCRTIRTAFHVKAAILLPDTEKHLKLMEQVDCVPPHIDFELGQWAFDQSEPAGNGTRAVPTNNQLYLPLRATARNEGVLVLDWSEKRLDGREQRRLLYTFAALMAGAAERLHLLSVAQSAQVAMESERLRNSILAALSHDLRTPLTAVMGLSEILVRSLVREGSSQVRPASAITERLVGISALVANLLDMARFQSGDISLRCEWQSLEEVTESAVRSVEDALVDHPLHLRLPEELPLVYGDAVLLERVLANLFENAAKYTPRGAPITLTAWRQDDRIYVEISDKGPGIPVGQTESLFQKFHRGERESSTSGVGLGLSICRAIVRAHGGEIWARNRVSPEHGAILTWTLPYRESPSLCEISTESAAFDSVKPCNAMLATAENQ